MRTPQSERFISGLFWSLEKGAYREELHPRGEGGRWSPQGSGAVSPLSPMLAEAERIASLRTKIDSIAEEEAEDVRRQVIEHRQRIPTDYAALARRQEDRRRRAFQALVGAIRAAQSVSPVSWADAEIVRRAWRYVEDEARRGGKREASEVPWDDEFRAVMQAAEGVLRRVAASEGARSE